RHFSPRAHRRHKLHGAPAYWPPLRPVISPERDDL
ncbi:MAG: hypothetical protein AVDCRST_MAG37-1321, partial [uncultured Rubrobacteraceae bacterium]